MKSINKMMTSNDQDWATPSYFVKLVEDKLASKFKLDVCAYDHTAKASKWFTEEDDALTKEWDESLCWMNPPYGRELPKWLEYAEQQQRKHNNIIVCLVPCRPDTAWFHDYAVKGECILLRGRIPFERPNAEHNSKATAGAFPSMLVIFGNKPTITTWDWKTKIGVNNGRV